MTATGKAKRSRVHTDPRIDMPDGRVERIWEDPLLNPRHDDRIYSWTVKKLSGNWFISRSNEY